MPTSSGSTPRFPTAVLGLVAAVVAGCAGGSVPADNALTPELARIAERYRQEHGLPGLAVGVVKGGTVVLRQGFGTT